MFATRNFALWKEPEVISWLKSNIRICVQSRFRNTNDPDVKDAKALFKSLSSGNQKQKEPVLSYGPDGMLESDNSSQKDPWEISLRVCRHVMVSEYTSLARYLPERIVNATMHMHDPLPPPGSRNVYEERFEEQRRNSFGGLMGGTRDAAQNMLEGVVRRLLAGGRLPRLGGGGGGAGGAGEEDGAEGEAGELHEAQLRRVAEAVQLLRARHLAPGGEGALPGAFPDQGQPQPHLAEGNAGAATAGAGASGQDPSEAAAATLEDESEEALVAQNPSLSQSLSEVMRMLGFGGRTGAVAGAENGAEPGAGAEGTGETDAAGTITEAEANEMIMAAFMNDFGREYYDGEDGEEEEDVSDNEDQPFGPDGDDGWEPYDPAAYE